MTEKWAYFFKNAAETEEKDLEKIIGDDLIIKRAYEELDRYSWSPEELRTYDAIDMKQSADKAIHEGAFNRGIEQGLTEGLERGLAEGLEKGKQEEKKEIVQKMLVKGIDVEIIAHVTGFSIQEVQKFSKKSS